MAKTYKIALSIIALCFALNYSIYSCTTFCISTENELAFGKNYDWMISYGLVIVNKKNVHKESKIGSNSTPAVWTSKYGSVTFNQYGREFPSGGMNETGLVIELMWLDDTQYPAPDLRPSIGTLQWIQYQLDNCASIEEVIATDSKIRISNKSVPLHYLVADRTGKTISIEFIDGKLMYHTGETMPFKTLTNDTYKKSADYLKNFDGFGGNQPLTESKSSLDRFVKTCSMVKDYTPLPGRTAVDYGFDILKDVAQGSNTMWSIVYDIKNLKVYYKTISNSKIQNIEFMLLDFNCSSPVKIIDITAKHEGNINDKLESYTYEANRKLIEDAYNGVEFLKNTPAEDRDEVAKYPELLSCGDKSGSLFDDKLQRSSIDSGNNNVSFLVLGILLFSLIAGYFKKWK
jgi:choloylglycine hydrolase